MIRFAILLVLVIVAIIACQYFLSRPKPPVRQRVMCPECAGTGVGEVEFLGKRHRTECPMCGGTKWLLKEK